LWELELPDTKLSPSQLSSVDSDTVLVPTVTQEVYNVEAAEAGSGDGTGAVVPGSEGRLGEVQGVQSPAHSVGAAEAGDPAVYAESSVRLVPANTRLGYGKQDSQQGVHLEKPAGRVYACADCRDLAERVRKAFKEQGVEF
jgi:hypothetical protein